MGGDWTNAIGVKILLIYPEGLEWWVYALSSRVRVDDWGSTDAHTRARTHSPTHSRTYNLYSNEYIDNILAIPNILAIANTYLWHTIYINTLKQ